MARIEALYTLDTACEMLLRTRAHERGRDADTGIEHIRGAIESGKLHAVGVLDDQNVLHGMAAWRWQDEAQTYAQVLVLYTLSDTPAILGAALVGAVFNELARKPALAVIETRARDLSPSVRAALEEQETVFFERCRMTRPLKRVPVPLVAPPPGYTVTRWTDAYQPEVERVALAAQTGAIDDVVVPDASGSKLVEVLRRLRAGTVPGMTTWNVGASLVALDAREQVAGYIAMMTLHESGFVADVAVHPDHRRRGLGRLLMVRAMHVCREQGLSSVGLAVTTRNPARHLYDQLGFQAVDCGEVAIWWRDGRQLDWQDEV